MDNLDNSRYKCSKCGYVYAPEKGNMKSGIKPGTTFEKLSETWKCPRCRNGKAQFRPI
ncbi:MAG: rubredoxin [Clostridiales bacterium]|nr:rubredoxin [Clostridiales bacterium]